jgi:hypothetical protein
MAAFPRRGALPRAADFAGYADHPRYGRRPRFTGLDVADTPDGRVYCHWHSPRDVRVPGTAVAADPSRQGKATLPVTHYFDAKRVCRRCSQPFLFFAEEQKHWYEELRFPLEADCLDCAACRSDEHRLQAARRRYEALRTQATRTQAETLDLVDCGVTLVEAALFSRKLLARLRGLLKPSLLDESGPGHPRANDLRARLAALGRE